MAGPMRSPPATPAPDTRGRRRRHGPAALHQRHHRACPRAASTPSSLMHNAVGGQLGLGSLGDGGARPSCRCSTSPAWSACVHTHRPLRRHAGHHAALGSRLAGRLISRRKDDDWINIPTMVIDLLRPARTSRASTCRSLRYIERRRRGDAAGRRAAPAGAVRPEVPGRLRPHRDRRAVALPIRPRAPSSNAWAFPYLRGRFARGRSRDAEGDAASARSGEIITAGPRCSRATGSGRRRPPRPSSSSRASEFFRTGDIGRMDEDGYFFMTDRLKRMINASGFKVWPAEVEMLHVTSTRRSRRPASSPPRTPIAARPVKAVVVLRPTHKDTTEQKNHRLVPREHGGLQDPARGAVRRRLAEEGQRQGDVALAAGSGSGRRQADDHGSASEGRAQDLPGLARPCRRTG